MRRIYMNEDDAHFTSNHPAEDMTVAGLQRLVDYYAEETQVAAILFCTNLQKALFDSKVWEPLYEGYDPEGGPDQPFLALLDPAHREIIPGDHARNWVHNLWLLDRGRGIDRFNVWLDRCRHHGIEGWLTMRMNDCHGLKEYEQRLRGEGEHDSWAMLCPSRFWREHPELRRAPYRWERSWEGAFDFRHEQVRAHHLALIRELCERFDMDGLELDWLRWGMNFAPGQEAAGRPLLTAFVREARKLVDACAQRVGHPVQLGVRVPAAPQTAWSLGYDAPAWAREGLIDQVTLSSMGGLANFDYPIEHWRLLLGEGIRLLAHGAGVGSPYPDYGKPVGHDEIHHGVAASALQRGADGIYLFNECYRESGDPAGLKSMLQRIGDLATLADQPRRHFASFPGMRAAGDPVQAVLPIRLRNDRHGWDFGRMEDNISVRIPIGPKPRKGTAHLLLAFSPDTSTLKGKDLPVRLNGTPLKPVAVHPPAALAVNTIDWTRDYSDRIGQFLGYRIPLSALQADNNLVEILPPAVKGELRWAEIIISGT
ncbi:MAG TPA: hypothetical protein VGM23_13945 [Armatimonadota bacterium]|jgi:hypothetical protein